MSKRMYENDKEFFFKKSSLGAYLYDRHGVEEVHIFDRRSSRIIVRVNPALVTLSSYMDLKPMKQKKRPILSKEDISCINFLMDFWEAKHRPSCKNEQVFKKFRKLRK